MGIHFDRGQALFDLGRFGEAAQEYLLELSDNPESALAHVNLGAALFNCGVVVRWRLWPFFWKWVVAATLTLVFCVAAEQYSSPH